MSKRRTADVRPSGPPAKALALVPPPSLETADKLLESDRQPLYIAWLEAQLQAQAAQAAQQALQFAVGQLAAKYAATGFDPKTGQITRTAPTKEEG